MDPVVVAGCELTFSPLGVEGALRAELAEVVGQDRSDTVGCGFGRFESCSFPWTLTYDEAIYVIEGLFRVWVGADLIEAQAGSAVFLPRGTEIRYEFTELCFLFYVTYPVDWVATMEGTDA